MYTVVPNMTLVTQTKKMSCWFASGQMLIQWRANTSMMCEAMHPDPSLVQRWGKLYDVNTGIHNAEIPAFASDMGFAMVPPMSPSPDGIDFWLRNYGPLWVNGKKHVTVIAGIRDDTDEVKVLVYDPGPSQALKKKGEWRSLASWYGIDPVSGADTDADVPAIFLYVQ